MEYWSHGFRSRIGTHFFHYSSTPTLRSSPFWEDDVKKDAQRILTMRVFMDMAFLPLSTSFVERGALALGLEQKEAMALTLATEEIFSYLCRIGSPDQGLEIRSSSGHYYVQTEFSCAVHDFDMRLFNLTATISPEDETSLEQMGLLIASRFVDRLHVELEPGRGMLLTLIKEKAYPALEAAAPPPVRPLDRFSVKRPDPAMLKLFVHLLNTHYSQSLFPMAFRFPGKVVDMVAGGEVEAGLALAPGGRVGGGIFWHWTSKKTVECFGPFLFGQDPGSPMAEALLEACIGAIAKTRAVVLFSLLATDELPKEHFEVLGTFTLFDEKDVGIPRTAYFRQMHEDLGTSSWCHPEMESFLRREYERLVLPREILLVKDVGETRNPYSVLSAEFDRTQKLVTLYPVRSGRDAAENLVSHLQLFEKESIHNVLFMMDLGIPWHADFTPGLLRNGFTPRAVVPYRGEGDMIVFQLGAAHS
jgi:anti-sigma regulatory factor (Ser/Thr protein kinase)